jgi:Na+-translocating ferredoxin:NAD+ oxidoreductase RnfC subunit
LKTSRVRLKLSQHVGKPAQPIVKVGDRVTQGTMVGRVEEADLGVCIHASIPGTVSAVTDQFVEITA